MKQSATIMKQVTKEEFDNFLKSYPNELKRDVFFASEPPWVTYNDFQRAPKWPDSIVASHSVGMDNYEILKDIASPVISHIKPDLDALFDLDGNQIKEGDTIKAKWGMRWTKEGCWPDYRVHKVKKRNIGTNYETWSFEDCHNNLRGFEFWKIEEGSHSV